MSSIDYLDLCRLCLVKESAFVPIFDGEGDGRQIFLKIAACLPVKVTRDDKLPKKICNECVQKIELFYQFCNTTTNAEKQLLEWIGGVDLNDKQTYVSAVINQDQSSNNRLDGNVMQQTNEQHQNNIDMNMMESIGLEMPMMIQQNQTQMTINYTNNTNAQSMQSNTAAQQQNNSKNMDDSDDDHCGGDDDMGQNEELSVKEEIHDSNRTIEPAFVNVSIPCEEAGPSGLQQKSGDIPDGQFLAGQSTDGDPKSGLSEMPGIEGFIDMKPILPRSCDKCDILFSSKKDLIDHKVRHKMDDEQSNTTKFYNTYVIATVPSSPNNIQILLPKSDVLNKLIKIENLKTESITDNEQENESIKVLEDEQEVLVEEEINEEVVEEEKEDEGVILAQLSSDEFPYDEVNKESNEETMNEDDSFEDVYDDNINLEIANKEIVYDEEEDVYDDNINIEIANKEIGPDENIIIYQIEDDIDFKDETIDNSNNIESDELLSLEFDEDLQADNDDTTSSIEQSKNKDKKTNKKTIYQCDTCDFECEKKTTLYSHVSRKHRHANDNIYSCTDCDFTSLKKASLASHLKKHTKDEIQIFACSVCNYRTNKKTTLYSHIRHKHDPKQLLKLQQLYACPEDNCNYRNRSKHELKVHIARKHNDEYNFPCDQCDKKYKVKGDLTNHVRFDHIEKPVICEVCGKTCRNSHSLFVHQKFAHFKASFECNICKRRMVTQENLDEHMFRQHEHREHAQCPQCSKIFNKASVLKIHMRIHSGERPYACKLCEKKFVRRTALRQHALTHTDFKPYVCDVVVNGVVCGKSFTQKPGLTCHRKTHPGDHPAAPPVFISQFLTDVLDD
ncbi:hypothetical protein HCN44_002747 [Aphidius gifuensis]|uniref:Uncharacterized protein n=1 Tax=Aphidius gifuensis TaxID=684658 RepID=A0A834XPU1_APHGI|nr:hypothetical protein HCN44_002747 [Aphidius gifuensis]